LHRSIKPLNKPSCVALADSSVDSADSSAALAAEYAANSAAAHADSSADHATEFAADLDADLADLDATHAADLALSSSASEALPSRYDWTVSKQAATRASEFRCATC